MTYLQRDAYNGALRKAGLPCSSLGFSLVETVVGFALLGIVVVALYGSVTSGYLAMRMARDNLRATEIMTEKLERIRLYRWSQVNQPGLIATNFSVAYDSFSTNPIYNGTIDITPPSFSSNYTNQMRLVTVELTWTTGSVQRSRRMSTYVTLNGLHTYVF